MKFPEDTNLHLVTSNDETRYVLNFVAVQDGMAIATNGRTLAVCQVEETEDDERSDFYVPKDAVRQCIKQPKKSKDYKGYVKVFEQRFEVPRGEEERITHDVTDEMINLVYPKWPHIVPADARTFRIGLNAAMLHQLANALGGSAHAVLHIDPDDREAPIIVTVGHQDRFGVICPIKLAAVDESHLGDNKALQEALDRRATLPAPEAPKKASKNPFDILKKAMGPGDSMTVSVGGKTVARFTKEEEGEETES